MKNKKLCALFLAIIFMLNMSSSISFDVFAEIASHTYTYDNYEVEYAVLNEWEGNQSIKITVRNTGTESILNWALAYCASGEINGLWNAVSPKENIIKNAGYNYEIEPDKSVSFGYTLSGENLKLPEKFEIVSKRANVTEGYEVKFDVYDDWGDGFQGAVTITNTGREPLEAWTLSFDANFTIGNSWGGRIIDSTENSYTIASEMWTNPIMPNSSSSFGFTAAKEADTKAAADNFVLTSVKIDENAVPENPNEDIDYELDTDKDGLPNYYEDILGTDKNRGDTDGDGLSDGYEVLYLGTDPLKADTDENGINDGDEDLDKDGLTNIKECELGTDPNTADTDGDGLSDGAEANTHGTDPLKYDTDGDNVSDGDEVELGLNPLNPATNGYPDNEYTTEQSLEDNSTSLDYINTVENNPYTVSVDLTAAGVAENNLSVIESGYSNAIENSAIIGIAPEFVYKDGLSVKEATIKFKLDNSVINNTLGTYAEHNNNFKGIKRLNIFTFADEINMLLPVETFHDETSNTVYTKTDRMGTYCLVDMEIFFQNLGIEPSKSEESEVSGAASKNSLDIDKIKSYNIISTNTANSETSSTGYRNDFDVVFIIDEVNNSEQELKSINQKISDLSEEIWERSPSANVTVIKIDGRNTFDRSSMRVLNKDNNEELDDFLEEKALVQNPILYLDISKAVDHIAKVYESTNVYCVAFLDSNKNYYAGKLNNGKVESAKSTLRDIKYGGKDNINISVVSNPPLFENEKTYFSMMYNCTNGLKFDKNVNDVYFLNTMLNHIYGEVSVYPMCILSNNWKHVRLTAPITGKHVRLSKEKFEDLDASDLQGCADTDEDGLYDFQEIMFEFNGMKTMIYDENDEAAFAEPCLSVASLCQGDKILVDKVPQCVINFCNNISHSSPEYYEFISKKIVFVHSDPTKVDSDGDGIVDCIKYFKQGISKHSYYITEFDDPNPLKFEYLWQWPAINKDTGDKLNNIPAGFEDNRKHAAIDIGANYVNHDVIAAYEGDIIDMYSDYSRYKYNRRTGSGNYIFIKHEINGKIYYSRYLHLDSIEEGLIIGSHVQRGQKIATIGKTGMANINEHLDFQIGTLDDYYYFPQKHFYINEDGKTEEIEYQKMVIIGTIIDPILFNSEYTSQEKSSNPVYSTSNINMLINLPSNINKTCTDATCMDCLKFFNCTWYRDAMKLSHDEYECNERCIKCRYKIPISKE